jgi:hypothetical protein
MRVFNRLGWALHGEGAAGSGGDEHPAEMKGQFHWLYLFDLF